MSSREYSLAIKLDDTQLNAAIKKLQDAFGAIDVSVSGGTGGGGRDAKENQKRSRRSFERMRTALDKISKNSFQLIGIGIGITALVGLITKSSPMLSAMFKLMQLSVMLILRPIGDFIGFILKPIMMLILTQFIIPFYKTVYPIIKEWGPKIGEMIASLVRDPIGTIRKAIEGIDWGSLFQFPDIDIGGALKGLGIFLNNRIIKPILDFFETAGKWLNTTIIQPIVDFFSTTGEWLNENMVIPIVDFFTMLNESLGGIVGEAWTKLVKFFEFVSASVAGGVGQAWTRLVNFFNSVWAKVQSVLVQAWDAFIEWWSQSSDDVSGILSSAWTIFKDFFSILQSDTTGQVLSSWLSTVSFFLTLATDSTGRLKTAWDQIAGFFISIVNTLKSLMNLVQRFNPFGGSSSGGGGGSGGTAPPKEVVKWKGSNGKLYDSEEEANANSPPATKVTVKLQHGGVITEPIIGLGLQSGKRYSFGEAGAERITPLGKSATGGGGINIEINVGVITNDADLDSLIERIKTELQIAQSRLGVI